eukprot:1157539-Pelagomonas_calceolata.AAC.7
MPILVCMLECPALLRWRGQVPGRSSSAGLFSSSANTPFLPTRAPFDCKPLPNSSPHTQWTAILSAVARAARVRVGNS